MGKTLGYGEITVANVTEPFTVMLTNEAQQFATDSNRKVTSAQSYYTDIIVIRGSQERTDYTIGNITSGSGITVSKNSKRVTFSVSAGTTIGADAGVIEIPITLDGQTVKKQFSWSCGKQGPQGVKGQDGNSFAWNMLSETNCGKKHWGTESSGGKYSVEDFITEDNIDAVKLICTEAISTSNWSYVSFKDIKMLKQLKPSTKYTLSYDIKANRSGAISHSICKGDVSNFCTNTVVVNNIIGNETWQHISVVLTTNDLKTTPTNEILYLGRNALSKVGYSIIKNLKLVEGDIDTPWSPSQSDIEGKGVVETVQYYLATSQASGVTSSTSGWSTDITTQKLTADKKYLWNCYQTKYSDGTSEPISTPKVIGVYGDKGQNAKNLSITPSSQYFKSTDGGKTFAPNTITIKPTIQGEISFGKWQYSIDGGVSFADIVSGQKGLTINNNVLTVSKDSSLYSDGVTMVTFRAVANDSSFYDTCSIAKIYDVSDIGDGRNLLTGVSSYTKDTPFEKTDSRADGWTMYQNIITSIELEAGKKYVLQAKTDGNWAANHDTNGQDPSKKLVTLWLCSDKTNNCFDMRQGYAVFTPTVTAKYKLRVNQYSNGTDAYTIHLWDIKLEKGSSPTGWTPAPEDLQTAILSTKSEISDVSLKVDKNKQAIEQRVEKTTYQQDLNLVKGDISKANEGLNKWRYEIYPKSLFTDKPEDQRKISLDVFARNKNIIPTQSILLDDTKLGYFNYDDNYIGYAVTFVKMSEATKLETTFVHDDAGSFYLNGKLICTNGTNNFYSSATPDTVSCTLVKGWNCLEVVINEGAGSEGFKFGTVLSQLSTCQLMNCYYAMVTGRESQITNTLVQNTIDIEGVSTKVGKVTSIIGENGENFTDFKNDYSDFKQTMNGFKTTVGQTYVTKDDFNGLEIGGRNLLLYSQTVRAHNDYYNVGWLTDEVETFNGCPVWSVKNQWGKLGWSFKSHVIDRGLVKVGDTLTYSLYAKTNNASGKRIACSYRFKGNAQGYWFNDSAFNVDTSWARYSVTFTVTKDMLATDTYMNEIGFGETASMSGDDKVYYACPKLERGTKATDYTPAPEDNEINGQNLVSNLPSNWEQGGINGGQAVGSTYASIKSSTAYRIRIKDIFSVSGNITVSAGGTTTNSSKETLSFYGTLYDAKKGLLRETGWKSFPSTINCGDAKYMSIILRWGDGTKTQIAPSDISQICLKIERGTSATPFTLAPEDVNGKIVNVETIANQTADKFSWIVKSGTSSSNFEITDRLMNLVSANINLDGIVSFMNTAKGDGRKNLYNLDYSSFENVASQKDAICYAKDNGVTSVSIDSSVSYDGNKSLKISYTTANLNSSTTPLYLGSSANNYGCVKIQAGKQYLLSCYVKSDSTTGLFMIDIQGHDTPDTKTDGLYLSNIDPRKLPGSSTGVNLSTDWQRAVCAIKVADNATGLYWSVVPLIWGRPSSSSAPQTFNVWVDCIMLEEVDSISNEPGTYIFDKETIIDGGSIKTDTITGNQILAGSITADKIATDAIKSHNYISSGGTQGSFLNLGDGSFTSPNLSWDSNGNFIAKNANLSGQITATKGSIGGWSVDNYSIYTTYDADQNIFGSGISGTKGKYVLWAGETNNAIGANRSSDTPTDASLVIYNNGGLEVRKTMVGNDKKNHLYTTILQSGQINLKMDDNYIGTITATDTISSNSTVTMSHVSMAAKKGYGWSILHTDDSGNLISDIQRDPSDTKIKINSPITVSSTDISKYNAIETTGDVVVSGKIHANYGSNKIQLNPDNNGSIELYGYTPFIDFHYGNSDSDYTSRIIAQEWGLQIVGTATVTGDLYCDAHIYTCTNGHFSWAGQTDAYLGCGNYSGGNNIYYYANYHAFYVNNDSGSGMMYINTNGVTSRVGFTKTSDERIKKNFESFDDNIIDAYMNIEPVKYQLKQSSNDNYHFGFKAQHVDKVFSDYGDTYNESFDICTSRPIDPDKAKELYGVDDMTEEYGLRYDELIAPTTYMVQHIYKELESTKGELAKVKQEKADLETRLQAIEAKLGL